MVETVFTHQEGEGIPFLQNIFSPFSTPQYVSGFPFQDVIPNSKRMSTIGQIFFQVQSHHGHMGYSSKLRIVSPDSQPNIGMSICPGKIDPWAGSGPCARDLDQDIRAIRNWGADIVVTLLERDEMDLLHVPALGKAVEAAGMDWQLCEIVDQSPLYKRAMTSGTDPWKDLCAYLLTALTDGRKVFIHCRGGLGRTGTLAARLLIERGLSPEKAIREVRIARPGAIETAGQEEYLKKKIWMSRVCGNSENK